MFAMGISSDLVSGPVKLTVRCGFRRSTKYLCGRFRSSEEKPDSREPCLLVALPPLKPSTCSGLLTP